MASEHHKISPRYWVGARRQWTDREKLLGLYLLSCPHRSTEGLYHLPKAYMAADLGWTAKQIDDALATVLADGMVMYDPCAEVVLLPNALKRQRPTTEKQIAGAVRSLQQVTDTVLWEPFLQACDRHAPNLAVAIRKGTEGPPNGHCETHPDGCGNDAGDRAAPTQAQAPSTPPQPPTSGGSDRKGTRADGTSPRQLAKLQLVQGIDLPDAEHIAAFEPVLTDIHEFVTTETWHLWLQDLHVAGIDPDGTLVLSAPAWSRAYLADRFRRVIEDAAAARELEVRIATGDEAAGLERAAA